MTLAHTAPSNGASIYQTAPGDSRAVYLTPANFPVRGDGVADDSAAVQAAVDQVAATTRQGIVFVPEGRYRLTRTIDVWPGIRLIGYGPHRPAFVLGDRTAGFQSSEHKYLFWFTGGRGASGTIRDANPGTFYSAMSNVNVEIGAGNPGAVGVRSHWAQHCFLAHMDFRAGAGHAGVEQIGNFGEDLRFFGGDYGIDTAKPSPSWPYALLDSSFEGQRVAAIKTEEAGLTLVRDVFSGLPTAVSVNENRAEELLMKDCRLERISGPAVVINDLKSARTEVNLVDVQCAGVSTVAAFREGGGKVAGPIGSYRIRRFMHGLQIADLGARGAVKSTLETVAINGLGPLPASDIPMPPPTDTWVNVRSFGAKGDGETDDTAAFHRAIERSAVIYVPSGRYIVRDTLALRAGTALIGLNPITTQIALADSTPGYQAPDGAAIPDPGESGRRGGFNAGPGFPGGPKALLETPPGGTNLVSGIALDTGGINPRAVAAKWQAGAASCLNDVKFYGGHGSVPWDPAAALAAPRPGGAGQGGIYNNNRTADADARRKWDAQYPSLWITNGGGGAFADIWTASTFAQAGMSVSDTAGPGRVYAMSSEHHVRNEIKFTRAKNWEVYALQMEEERGEGPDVLPLSIDDCVDLTFGNLYIYRVMSTYSPSPYGVWIHRSHDLRFDNVHTYGPSKFTVDDTLFDGSTGAHCRSREIASIVVSGREAAPAPSRVTRLEGGFNNIDSLTTDHEGDVYFVDARWHRIYRYMPEQKDIELLRDNALSPAALAFDRSGNVLVLTSTGAAYSFRPGTTGDRMEVLQPLPLTPNDHQSVVFPTTRWRDSHDFLGVLQNRPTTGFKSPDGTLALPVDQAFLNAGPMGSMFSTIDLIRAYQLTVATPAATIYVADEFGQKTYVCQLNSDGTLGNPRVFAEEGEAGVTTDARGNVYVCAGDIFVYAPSGRLIDRIEVPERPTSIAFGGPDRRTLFIAARHSLYSIRVR